MPPSVFPQTVYGARFARFAGHQDPLGVDRIVSESSLQRGHRLGSLDENCLGARNAKIPRLVRIGYLVYRAADTAPAAITPISAR